MIHSIRSLSALTTSAFVATTLLTNPLCAQTVPFPLDETSRESGQVHLNPVAVRMREIVAFERVTLTGVPLPDGTTASLELRRVLLHLNANAVRVDGAPDRRGPDPSFSLWNGKVAGQPDSSAFLAFSSHGSRGWFGRPGNLHHLLAQPGAQNDWSRPTGRLVSAQFVQNAGPARDLSCQLLTPADRPDLGTPPNRGGQQAGGGGPLPIYDAPIAFETDYEFYQLFNDLDAAQAYALALIGAVSDRYRESAGVIFTLPYIGFYTQNNDPWTNTQCRGRLDQFRNAWRNGGAPVRAELYHHISGVRVSGCGGIAYLNVLCNQDAGFGMSAHINSNLTFPPVQGPLTWDFMVLAHELGHNFSARHTHDYGIDNCAGGDCSVTPNGTIMSYCHTCPGGMRNINLQFHPQIKPILRNAIVNSCFRRFDGILTGDAGNALAGSNGTPTQDVTYSRPTVSIDVASAPLGQAGAIFVGFREANQPFLGGGILVPRPDVALPIVADASGDMNYSFTAPASVPAGITIWTHPWFLDATGPNGFAASNATRVELIRP